MLRKMGNELVSTIPFTVYGAGLGAGHYPFKIRPSEIHSSPTVSHVFIGKSNILALFHIFVNDISLAPTPPPSTLLPFSLEMRRYLAAFQWTAGRATPKIWGIRAAGFLDKLKYQCDAKDETNQRSGEPCQYSAWKRTRATR